MLFLVKRSLLLFLLIFVLILCPGAPVLCISAKEESRDLLLKSLVSIDLDASCKQLYGAVQQVLVAIEKNVDFKDTKNHPEQLGELLVRSKSALSTAESVLDQLKISGKSEETASYMEACQYANQALKSLYSYLVGLVDGQPKERLWTDYLFNMGKYLDLTRVINEKRQKNQLEKGVLFDLLAKMKSIMDPAIMANTFFCQMLEEDVPTDRIFLASVKARDASCHSMVDLNNMVFPREIENPAFRDVVHCSSLYRAYSLYMIRVLDMYGSSVDNKDLSLEMADLINESRTFLHQAEGVIRTLKGSY